MLPCQFFFKNKHLSEKLRFENRTVRGTYCADFPSLLLQCCSKVMPSPRSPKCNMLSLVCCRGSDRYATVYPIEEPKKHNVHVSACTTARHKSKLHSLPDLRDDRKLDEALVTIAQKNTLRVCRCGNASQETQPLHFCYPKGMDEKWFFEYVGRTMLALAQTSSVQAKMHLVLCRNRTKRNDLFKYILHGYGSALHQDRTTNNSSRNHVLMGYVSCSQWTTGGFLHQPIHMRRLINSVLRSYGYAGFGPTESVHELDRSLRSTDIRIVLLIDDFDCLFESDPKRGKHFSSISIFEKLLLQESLSCVYMFVGSTRDIRPYEIPKRTAARFHTIYL